MHGDKSTPTDAVVNYTLAHKLPYPKVSEEEEVTSLRHQRFVGEGWHVSHALKDRYYITDG